MFDFKGKMKAAIECVNEKGYSFEDPALRHAPEGFASLETPYVYRFLSAADGFYHEGPVCAVMGFNEETKRSYTANLVCVTDGQRCSISSLDAVTEPSPLGELEDFRDTRKKAGKQAVYSVDVKHEIEGYARLHPEELRSHVVAPERPGLQFASPKPDGLMYDVSGSMSY